MTTILEQTTNDERLSISGANSVWNGSGRYSMIPFTMPSAQTYYWSFDWQSGERETLSGLEAGEYVEFDSPDDPEDAARWLREPDDDE